MSCISVDNSCSDNFLVSRAKGGDGMALSMLIERYSNMVFQKANSFKNLKGLESDDLYQEGMIGFVSSIYSFDETRGVQFNTYSSTLSVRRMLTALRKSNNANYSLLSSYISLDENGDMLSQTPSPEELMIYNEELNEIFDFIDNNLSKLEKKVFKLIVLGVSYAEIAEIIDCSTKSVDNAIQRIRRKIRNFKLE